MREKKLKILSIVYLSVAFINLIICVWNVIIRGLFAPAVDIRGGIGVALVCALVLIVQCALLVRVGMSLRQKFTAKTFKMVLGVLGTGLFSLIFLMIGQYIIIPALLAIALPVATLFFIK